MSFVSDIGPDKSLGAIDPEPVMHAEWRCVNDPSVLSVDNLKILFETVMRRFECDRILLAVVIDRDRLWLAKRGIGFRIHIDKPLAVQRNPYTFDI